MILDPYGREFYRLTITTTPQVTAWEASFDDGATWVVGAVDSRTPSTANTWEWLVAGESRDNTDLTPGLLAGVITKSMQPKVRCVDTPEVIVRQKLVPEIDYKQA